MFEKNYIKIVQLSK